MSAFAGVRWGWELVQLRVSNNLSCVPSNRLQLDSPNVVESFSVEFDVSLDTFLSDTSTFDPAFCLDTVFANVTNLLDKVANYAPDLNAGNTPTALEGLFDALEQAKDFGGALTDFIDLVKEGKSAPRLPVAATAPLYRLSVSPNEQHMQ